MIKAITVILFAVLLASCTQDMGELIVTDDVFIMPGCEAAKQRNENEPC